MAAPMEEAFRSVADIRPGISRNLSTLGCSSSSRLAKKRALESMRKETVDKTQQIGVEILQKIFYDDLRKPLLMCFNDPIEKCRELSIQLVHDLIDVADKADELLPYLIPCVAQRLAQKEIIETAEELRLNLVELLFKVIEKWGKSLGVYVNELVNIFQKTLVDPFPDVRKISCKCVCSIARKIPEHFHLQSESLINPLLQSSSHQYSKVRAESIRTIGDVLQYGNPKPMERVTSHLAQRLFDDSAPVRQAVTEVVGNWLLDYIDRYSYHHKLIPLLLTSQTDEIPEITKRANNLWDEVGAKYLKENEEELKDQLHYEARDYILPPGQDHRPNLGCRTLVARNLSKILPGLLNDLTDWTPDNRKMSSRLLKVLLLNAEDNTTQHVAKLLPGLYRACLDEEREVVEQVFEAAKLTGFFVGPEVYCMLILPAISSNPTTGVLMTFSALLRGTQRSPLQNHLREICKTLTQPEVYRSEKVSYQLQLLSCVDSMMSCSGEDCREVSLQLFFILVSIQAQATGEPLKAKVKSSLSHLAALHSMDSVNDLFAAHSKDVLVLLKGNFQEWGSFSVERAIFDTLLLEAGPVVGSLLEDIVPVLSTNLKPDKDPELRLKLFSLLSRLLLSASGTLNSQDSFGPLVPTVVKDMIIPNCVWHGGRTAAAIRTTAVSCLWALLKSGLISADQLLEMMPLILPQISTLLEDDVYTTRLVSCRCLQRILDLCRTRLHPDILHTLYMELLKRLDDSRDEIRLAVAKTFVTYFSCFPEQYDRSLYKAHIETLYRGLLVHMDDSDADIQQAILDVLKQAARIHPVLLKEEVEAVRERHRSLVHCDELLEHLKMLNLFS